MALGTFKIKHFYSMNSFAFMQLPKQTDCRKQVFISGFDQIKRQNLSLQLLHTEVLVEIRAKAMFTLPNHNFCWHISKKSFEYFILLGYDAASLGNRILTFPATQSLHLQRSNCPKNASIRWKRKHMESV
jgi:hypothetical protein